ncbi:MAG: hypothetical protein JNK27_08445 [Chitinophagaceae bacterium]|nr:hypothetical protein [Chitinophagaceae bacterium]
MENKTLVFFLSFITFGQITFGQNNKIKAVENNLTEVRELIFEDTIISKYNILDRMKFYKIPSVSIAVINDGKLEWTKTYGYADIEKKN